MAEAMIESDARLRGLVQQIVRHFDPLEIRLFGSRGRGDWHEASDYDLLIVVDDAVPRERASIRRAYELIDTSEAAADLVLVRRSAFEVEKSEVGTLSPRVAREGRVVHER
jgi:predicted nucleotidyltransferase